MENTLTLDIEPPQVGHWGDHLLVVHQPVPRTRTLPADISCRFEATGQTLLATYAGSFDQVFIPYNGPDEPPKFEPEDYPVR